MAMLEYGLDLKIITSTKIIKRFSSK